MEKNYSTNNVLIKSNVINRTEGKSVLKRYKIVENNKKQNIPVMMHI